MSFIVLSKEQRDLFAMWLETQIATNVGLMEQADRLSGPTAAMLKGRMQQRNAAYALVAHELRSTHEDSIGG